MTLGSRTPTTLRFCSSKHPCGRLMSRRLLFVTAVSVSILIFSVETASQQRPAGKKSARMQIIKGPALESATDNSAIIRWTTNTGSSLIEHPVVHYGMDPKNLNRRAESPNRWNQNLHYMIHRVSVMNLTPRTTYYYTVESVRGDGMPLGGRSNTINQFTTRQHQ
jgi:phosphodiesterase/alkaline phosphatase D-like protein